MMMQNFFSEFITKFIEDSFINFGGDVAFITVADVFIACFWSILLSFVIAITYRGTHRGVSYSQNFTQNLVLIGLVVAIVMLVIGSDIARAFTLVGALSIIRFRNAIKDTRDVGFIFFTMAIGMACGTRFYILAIITAFVGCGLIYFMTSTNFGQKGFAQDIIEIYFPTSKDYAKILSPIFIKHLKYYSILGVDSIDDKTNRLSFIVTFKKKSKPLLTSRIKKNREVLDDLGPKAALLKEIQALEYIKDVKVIDGSNAIEI